MQVIYEGNEKTLEYKVDKELAELGVRPYVYHIRAYDEGSRQELLWMFNGITIVDIKRRLSTEVDVYRLIEKLRLKLKKFARSDLHPATWMMIELRKLGYYGVAICDRRDNFSRKRGRIIAKGRLLKHLRSRYVMIYDRMEMDQRVVAKGRLVASSECPELPDGTNW